MCIRKAYNVQKWSSIKQTSSGSMFREGKNDSILVIFDSRGHFKKPCSRNHNSVSTLENVDLFRVLELSPNV